MGEVRKLQKKLRQIENLELKVSLTPEEAVKVHKSNSFSYKQTNKQTNLFTYVLIMDTHTHTYIFMQVSNQRKETYNQISK